MEKTDVAIAAVKKWLTERHRAARICRYSVTRASLAKQAAAVVRMQEACFDAVAALEKLPGRTVDIDGHGYRGYASDLGPMIIQILSSAFTAADVLPDAWFEEPDVPGDPRPRVVVELSPASRKHVELIRDRLKNSTKKNYISSPDVIRYALTRVAELIERNGS